MGEVLQIVFNIAVLGVLFCWVWWGTRKAFATKNDLLISAENTKSLVSMLFNKNQNAAEEMQGEIFHLLGEIDRLSEMVDNAPSANLSTAIQTGATIARESIECGSRIVLDALARDGRVSPQSEAKPVEAVNLGEEDYEFPVDDNKLPDIIVARNQKVAEQIGDRLLGDLMEKMNEKI